MENFDEFGEFAEKMWFSHPMSEGNEPRKLGERDLAIMALGLCGEAGEVTEKVKKHIRDSHFDREEILKELGDVVFYAVTIARYYGFKASDILNANVHKLESRRQRGTERGSGDNR